MSEIDANTQMAMRQITAMLSRRPMNTMELTQSNPQNEPLVRAALAELEADGDVEAVGNGDWKIIHKHVAKA